MEGSGAQAVDVARAGPQTGSVGAEGAHADAVRSGDTLADGTAQGGAGEEQEQEQEGTAAGDGLYIIDRLVRARLEAEKRAQD